MENNIAGEKIIYYDHLGKFSGKFSDFNIDNPKINEEAIFDFLLFGSILPPNSIYKNINSMFPGEKIIYSNNKLIKSNNIYKELAQIKPLNENIDYFVNKLDSIFQEYFNKILENNKNISIFLSGGVDSALIASYLPKRTVCVSWGGWGEESTDIIYSQKTFKKFSFKQHIIVLSDYKEDKKLYNEIVNKIENPLSFTSISYLKMSKAIRLYYGYDKNILCFSGQNADTILWAFSPTIYSYYFSKINIFFKFLPFKKFQKYKRKFFLLTSSNPVKIVSFFHSNGIYPGDWLKIPKQYFCKKKRQIEEQIGIDIKKVNHFILLDELATEARRNQYAQNYLPNLFDVSVELPFYNEDVIRLFLQIPQKIRRKNKFGKIIIKKLAEKRGVPSEVINKKKKGMSYGYTEYLNKKMYIPIWEEMEKSKILNEFINIKLIRKKYQNNFFVADRLLGLHYYFKYNLKLD